MSSRSGPGTFKTTPFINVDSPKYIERAEHGRSKYGSSSNGTDAAHRFSFGLMNVLETHSSGAPMSSDTRRAVVRDMNSDSNLRIKSDYGNRVLDERRDARIAQAFVHGEAIRGDSTATRAFIAYQAASNMESTSKHADLLGNMRVYNAETGRSHFLKNHYRFV
jgi:hypothetical protein